MIAAPVRSGPAASLAPFRLTTAEWLDLDKKFGKLCRFQARSLVDKNAQNSHTDDRDDIYQEMCQSMVVAAMYFKRQCYIEESLRAARRHATDPAVRAVVERLNHLWRNKTKHGANRQRFGRPQEQLLDAAVAACVPPAARPDRGAPLRVNAKFATYCKTNTWNRIKTMGRKITKERAIRGGLVSLSSFAFLTTEED